MSPDGDFNAHVVEEFRANGGRVGGALADTAIMLIHHLGARSGIERVLPVAYSPRSDGRWVVVASAGGSPAHPAWCHNLRAHPRIEVEVGTQRFTVLAEELAGAARAEVWAELTVKHPALGEFQSSTIREFPVFLLTRQDQSRQD